MAKMVALVVSALCLLAVAANAQQLTLQGEVYCDPCRIQVKSKDSKSVEGAIVNVLCTRKSNGNVTYSTAGKTDKEGRYSIPIEGVHGDYNGEEVCEVKVTGGLLPGCDETMDTTLTGVDLTANGNPVRYAKSIGFMTKEVAPECKEMIVDLSTNEADEEDENSEEQGEGESEEESEAPEEPAQPQQPAQ